MTKHPMFETVASPSNWPPRVGKLSAGQIAHRSTWTRHPDESGSTLAALHVVAVEQTEGHTVTVLNPMDPGTVDDAPGELGPGWLVPPAAGAIPLGVAGRR